jgi:predicted protein tyrosine phosphatase
MISLIEDLNGLVSTATDDLVSSIAEYALAYEKILEAFTAGRDLTLYVRDATVMQWFAQMSSRYPQESFKIESIDARCRLEELWGIPIPKEISNEEIVAGGLLDLDISPPKGAIFENVILDYFYHPLFTGKTFPVAKLSDLLTAYDSAQWDANTKNPLVCGIYSKRLAEWKTKAKDSNLRRLIELFSADVDALKLQLMQYKVLRFYKALGHKLMGDDFSILESLKPDLWKLNIDESGIKDIVTQITYILNADQEPATVAEMETVISNMSGYLAIEFEKVETILKNRPDLITADIINALGMKFEAIQDRVGRRLKGLKGMVQPPFPLPFPFKPDQKWILEEVINWATHSYLPYQFWCALNNRMNKGIYKLADEFAQWLYRNWQDIHSNSKRMVFNILPNNADRLKSDATVNLVLVIDNLWWGLVPIIKDLFQVHGFFLSKVEPYLSMLPSETEISKKCLLSGAATYNDIDNKTYKNIIEKGWVPYFNDATFQYLSDPGKLAAIGEITGHTYVINYLAIDRALHMSSDQIGMGHLKYISSLLEGFVETIVEFIDKHDLKKRIVIHVVTDHGSTTIPAHIANDLDLSGFKSTEFSIRSSRYIAVSSEKFSSLPDNWKEDCFFLDATEFGNDSHYLSARRGNRFVKTDDTSYAHGGLSPEEVIVPHLIFEAVKVPLQYLTLLLVHNEFRYRKEKIMLEIGNPNEFAVEDTRISIINSNIEADQITIDLLNGKNKSLVEITAQFKQTANVDERNNLVLHISFTYRDEKHEQSVTMPIKMRAMVETKGKTVFEDLD